MDNSAFFDKLVTCTIIEHRTEGPPVVGRIDYTGRNPDGSVCIGWNQEDRCNRTVLFSPQSWKWFLVWNVLFFERIEVDDDSGSDLPWKTANNYTVVMNR